MARLKVSGSEMVATVRAPPCFPIVYSKLSAFSLSWSDDAGPSDGRRLRSGSRSGNRRRSRGRNRGRHRGGGRLRSFGQLSSRRGVVTACGECQDERDQERSQHSQRPDALRHTPLRGYAGGVVNSRRCEGAMQTHAVVLPILLCVVVRRLAYAHPLGGAMPLSRPQTCIPLAWLKAGGRRREALGIGCHGWSFTLPQQ